MFHLSVHAAARILLVIASAVAIEIAQGRALGALVLLAAGLMGHGPIRAHSLRLLRRSRWLLIVIFASYALTLPGEAVWPLLGHWGPSWPGLEFAALRGLRLVLMLIVVAALLASTPLARLVYGLFALIQPFSALGGDARAFAVRLGLTLQYVEHGGQGGEQGGGQGDWRAALAGSAVDTDMPRAWTLQTERWHVRDSAVVVASALALGVLLVWGQLGGAAT